MNLPRVLALVACLCTGTVQGGEAFFDRIEDALTFTTANQQVRLRLSGTLDLEAYHFQTPPPMILRARGDSLYGPRLSTFLDAQLGSRVYVFAQARADRGFDPAQNPVKARLDEYAVRYSPWQDGRFNVQVGKFGSVVGNWITRHGSWANPFITAPLPYEYLTGMWDNEAVRTSNALLEWSHVRPGRSPNLVVPDKRLRLPIIWGPAYSIGAAVAGEVRKFTYALEVKHASLSSRPRVWHHLDEQRGHPTVAGRLGFRPSAMWDFGVSASAGSYLRQIAGPTLAPGHGLGDYRQIVVGQDVTFAWRHLQIWTEIYAARFEIPTVGEADTLAYYVEAKYRLSPPLSLAVRWNQQVFGTIPDPAGPTRWGHDVWRVDLGPAYRFTPHMQLKFQYSLQRGDSGTREHTRTMAGQLTVRF